MDNKPAQSQVEVPENRSRHSQPHPENFSGHDPRSTPNFGACSRQNYGSKPTLSVTKKRRYGTVMDI
ncbi:hypothetical protein Golomagni_06417 [Golovinomyces magnicellulatus]|nr:hypothetical protein Golomagni_06417 [Golovinomyces magnicellulatus]